MSEIQRQREKVRSKYGSEFEKKASDELVRVLAGPPGVMAAVRRAVRPSREAAATLARAGVEPSLVVEVKGSPAEPPGRVAAANLGDRQTGIARYKDAFQRASAPLRVEIEKQAAKALGQEAAARAIQSVWIADSLRTPWMPEAVTELAAAPGLARLDVPRRLKREISLSCGTVGAPALRQAHDVSGTGVRVAVIDGEVWDSHPGLQGRVVPKGNYTREPTGHPDSHGTAVAGIVASADAQYTGVAPGATIYSYKVFATDPTLDADDLGGAAALQQALQDAAQVANCSWGAGLATDGTSREARACDRAWALGLTIVKSAGNSGTDGSLTTPADAAGVLVVGGTNRPGATMADYSSWGTLGGGMTRPHLVAPGGTDADGVLSCLSAGGFGPCGSGTSFAAPHVTGLIALVLEHNPDLTPGEIRAHLVGQCRPLQDTAAARQGAGLVVLTVLA